MTSKVTNAPAYRSLLNQLTPEAKETVEKLGTAFDQAIADGELEKVEAYVLGLIRDQLKSSGFDEELNVAGRLLGDPTNEAYGTSAQSKEAAAAFGAMSQGFSLDQLSLNGVKKVDPRDRAAVEALRTTFLPYIASAKFVPERGGLELELDGAAVPRGLKNAATLALKTGVPVFGSVQEGRIHFTVRVAPPSAYKIDGTVDAALQELLRRDALTVKSAFVSNRGTLNAELHDSAEPAKIADDLGRLHSATGLSVIAHGKNETYEAMNGVVSVVDTWKV